MADRAKTCLITGGNGYLGSELASLLRASGWRVISAERRPHGSDSVAYSLDGEVSPTLFGGVDALIHGAYDFRPRSWDAIYRKNVLGSRKLIEKAKAAGVATLLISSISAFPGCNSSYGKAKLLLEEITLAAGGIVLRPGVIYGGSNRGIFGRLLKQVKYRSVIPLLTGNPCVLHLTRVDDLARMIDGCLRGVWNPAGTAWVVAHPEPWPMRELLVEMGRGMGKKPIFLPTPWQPVFVGLKFLEAVGLPSPFTSDNLISLVNQDPHLDFKPVQNCGVGLSPFKSEELDIGSI
jgi:nucleoside-diphosphate-sugar epimerase